MEASNQKALLTQLRDHSRSETATNKVSAGEDLRTHLDVLSKLSRTLRALSEPPADIPLENMVSESAKEIIAAEKLQALEVGKIPPERRTVPERYRTA